MKLRGLTTKWILRQAVRTVLPREILTRRKMGFPVPFAMWMRTGWADVARDILLDRRTRERGLFEPRAVRALIDSHSSGRAHAGDVIWSLLNLELWYRTFIDGDGIQTLSTPGSAPDRHTTQSLRATA
jgi:asparagine synthase (glutamine-hydrolysing)